MKEDKKQDFLFDYQQKERELLWEFKKKRTSLQADYVRELTRMTHPNKTDEELGLDQPFLQEQTLEFAEEDFHKIQNFFDKIGNKFKKR